MLYYEHKYRVQGYGVIIGVDEAGRGPLAGPVVAAAVALTTFDFENRIDDSKKLSPAQRERAFPEILAKSVYGVGVIGERIIDRVNILQGTRLAMQKSVRTLIEKLAPLEKDKPGIVVLVDGNVAIDTGFRCVPIVRGDARSKSIACDSIVAKVIRDRIMTGFDRLYPQYGFKQHKGYPTEAHRQAIRTFGISKIHRTTFHSV